MTQPTNPLQAGYQHHIAGRLREAEAIYCEVLATSPDDAAATYLLGVIAHQSGRLAESLPLLEKAARLAPAEPDLHNYLSIALRDAGRIDEAIASARRAIAARPTMAEAHFNLGMGLQKSGDLAAAAGAYQTAIRLAPAVAPAHNNLGNILQAAGRLEEAEAAYRRAIECGPTVASSYNNLGSILQDLERPDEALDACRRAVELDPAFLQAHNNLANALRARGEVDAALAAYRRGIELKPDYAIANSNLLFALHFMPEFDAAALRAEHERWAAAHAEPLTRAAAPLLARDRSPDRRLRIGYVSADYREHPVGRFMLPIIAKHDRGQFETVVYSDVRGSGDQVTSAIARAADRFVESSPLEDAALAARIRADEIDILVDLALHSGRNRLLVFARRAAPVQVTYLGYPGTSGMSAMDYRLTDPYLDPPDSSSGVASSDAAYTERSVRLPHTYWCYVAPPNMPVPAPRPPSVANSYVTFGCLNKFTKVSDLALRTWATLLSRVPGSRLLLHAPIGVARQRVLKIMWDVGVAGERIEFVERQTAVDYFATYHRIDIALDPLPYNGGTTTCETLLMGVPAVSLSGDCAVRRSGSSILTNAGLSDLITTTTDAYIDVAARLAADAERLSDLRSTLRRRMLASPLTDWERFVRDLESAYRTMWRESLGRIEATSRA